METINITCEAKDIIECRETKEYANIPSFIIRNIKSNQEITAQARNLWFILYDKAKFNPELEIKVSIKWLVSEFGRSMRSIQRYITSLIAKGYLVVKNNFNHNGQTVNTYAVRVPANVITRSTSEKNREKPNKETPRQNCHGGDAKSGIRNTIKYSTNKKQQQDEPTIVLQTTSVEPANKVESVVVSSAIKNKKQEINADIAELESQRIDAQENFNKNPLHHENLKTLTRIEQRIEQKKLQLEKMHRVDNANNKLNSVLDAEGKRSVSDSLRKMLASKLKKIGRNEQDIQRLTNEIAYEARFGSLVFDNQTKRENPVTKSVNIALKLINEGRWATPSCLATC